MMDTESVTETDSAADTATANIMTDRTRMQLVCRVAELETELFLAREALRQSNESKQYLIEYINGWKGNFGPNNVAAVSGAQDIGTSNGAVKRKDSITNVMDTFVECISDEQFVDPKREKSILDEDDVLEDQTPSLVPSTVQDSKPDEESIGQDTVSENRRPSIGCPAVPSEEPLGFTIYHQDDTTTFVYTGGRCQSPCHTIPRRQARPFLDWEHRKLAGNAFVWAEMTAEELTEVFARYAKEHPKHSAEEYHSYFEECIRPAHEERESRLQKAREALLVPLVSIEADEQAQEQDPMIPRTDETEGMVWTTGRLPSPDSRTAEDFENDVQRAFGVESGRTGWSSRTRQQELHNIRYDPGRAAATTFDTGYNPNPYCPPAEVNLDLYNTMVVSNTSVGTTLSQVLDQIHDGGGIYSAVFLNTAGLCTNPRMTTETALIKFLHDSDASSVVKNWKEHTNTSMTVQLVETVSRPIPSRIWAEIDRINLSRVLFIKDGTGFWTPGKVLRQLMRHGVRYPLKVMFNPSLERTMHFHFASLAEAKAAWLAVTRDHTVFDGIPTGFVADPCSGPAYDGESEGLSDGWCEYVRLTEET